MTDQGSAHREEAISLWSRTSPVPSILTEYGYYLYLSYTLLGAAFGLFINNLGSAFLALLLVICLLQLRSRFLTVLGLAAFPLGCAITHVFIQYVLYEESATAESVRAFILWAITVLVIQSLALRKNFLQRFAIVAFFIGLAFIPFIRVFEQSGGYQRLGLDRAVGYANPNSMAEWYGFCTVYFAILGITTKRNVVRTLSWLSAIGCLYMVTLAVSRGTLFAVVAAVLIAGRHLLKHGFLPVLLLACIGGIIVELGIFGEAIRSYGTRGTEETGRLSVWPLIFESFLSSPLIGVGASKVGAILDSGRFVTPHNCFLFLAQASGIIPVALFVGYWIRAAWTAIHATVGRSADDPFRVPLLVYTLLFVQTGDTDFMMPVAVVALAMAMTAGVPVPRPVKAPVPQRGRLELQEVG